LFFLLSVEIQFLEPSSLWQPDLSANPMHLRREQNAITNKHI
jgi:hypothetical protein